MTVTNYNNKHVFLSSANPHIINLLLNLIEKRVLSKNNLILLFEKKNTYAESLICSCQSYGITALYYSNLKDTKLKFSSLNCLSLQPLTAKIAIDFIGAGYVTSDKISILITDDEIDRWLILYKEIGKININNSALIDKSVLQVLEEVDNYITPYTTWGKPLENILGRKLNIIDAVLPFNVLDYQSQEYLEAFLHSRKRGESPSTYRILLFTKQQSPKEIFNIIKSFLSGKVESPSNLVITIGVWLPLSPKGMMLYMSLKALIKLKKLPILLRLEQPVSSEQYALMLHEYDCLILQERGGFSTAKYFAENVGKLITLKDSFNDRTLNVDYGIETFNSKSYIEAIKDAISAAQKNEVDSISTFASQLTKKHEESFDSLRNYWNSF